MFLANLSFSPGFSCAAYKTYSFTRVKQLGTIRFLEPLQSYSAARKEGIGLEMGLTLKDSQRLHSFGMTEPWCRALEEWTMTLTKSAFVNELLVLISPKTRGKCK